MEAPCPFEGALLRAAREGTLSTADRSHLAQCASCREALWLGEVLSEAEPVAVPDAGLVYWRAGIRLRQERMEAALRPARWMERVALAGLMAAAVGAGIVLGQPLVTGGTVAAMLLTGIAAWAMRRV